MEPQELISVFDGKTPQIKESLYLESLYLYAVPSFLPPHTDRNH
jgi:hypothetical protein